jgi:cyclopropane fatty-acyl-phospholipid synthase-like methyltransferase
MLANGKEADKQYGLQWGDPDADPKLKSIVTRFIAPFVNPDHVVAEIGPGGGRWTRYMKDFRRIYAVDYHKELLDELDAFCSLPNIVKVSNNGNDFPGIEKSSIDFVFSFGVFVHLDVDIIAAYLINIRSILKDSGNAVIQYSDKTKDLARTMPDFSENTPTIMRRMVSSAGFRIVNEDITTLPAASIVHFVKG